MRLTAWLPLARCSASTSPARSARPGPGAGKATGATPSAGVLKAACSAAFGCGVSGSGTGSALPRRPYPGRVRRASAQKRQADGIAGRSGAGRDARRGSGRADSAPEDRAREDCCEQARKPGGDRTSPGTREAAALVAHIDALLDLDDDASPGSRRLLPIPPPRRCDPERGRPRRALSGIGTSRGRRIKAIPNPRPGRTTR